VRREVSKAEHDEALARVKERFPGLHFAANGAMHVSELPCLVCDQETVDDYRRQQRG
jgi:hypothetical protein